MHELSVCQSIIGQVTRIAAEHHARCIDKIYLQIGPLSGVEPELLRSAFSIACAETVAAHAELVIRTIPVTIQCQRCHKTSEVAMNRLVCRHCGNWQTQLISGNELLLERIELQQQH